MAQPAHDPDRDPVAPVPSAPEEQALDRRLRPATIDEFVGQTEVVANLRLAIRAARDRGEPLDHLLLSGLPGLGNFVGEFLVLLASFGVFPTFVVIAVIGIVVGTVTALIMMQRTFYEPREGRGPLADLTFREGVMLGALAIAIVFLGVRPQPVLDVAATSIRNVLATGMPFEPVDPDTRVLAGPRHTVAGARDPVGARDPGGER